ncbi:MAG: hypothetical protein RIQ53_2149 [Pseudomonadota bacterium]|jgi:CheY-like chemotaxis protein/PAS domain-containing protein
MSCLNPPGSLLSAAAARGEGAGASFTPLVGCDEAVPVPWQRLWQLSPQALLLLGREGRLLQANRAAALMLPERLLRPQHPAEPPLLHRMLDAAVPELPRLLSHRDLPVGVLLSLPSVTLPAELGMLQPVLGLTLDLLADGRLLLQCEDLSARQRLETQLREMQALRRFDLEALGAADWELDLDSGVLVASNEAQRMLTGPHGPPLRSLGVLLTRVHPDDRGLLQLRIRRAGQPAGEAGGVLQCECRMIWPDGSEHWVMLQGQLMPGPGQPWRLVGLVRLQDRERAARHDHWLSRRLAEELMRRTQGQPTWHGVLRLLRTPLQTVLGLAHLISPGMDSVSLAQRRQQLLQAAGEMAQMLEALGGGASGPGRGGEAAPADLASRLPSDTGLGALTGPAPLARAAGSGGDPVEGRLRSRHGGARVLLAEDNLVNQEVTLGLLRSAGLQAEAVGTGSQAVARALAEPFDLILMDVQMPELDGLEATRQLRRLIGDTLPILALTANTDFEDRSACTAAGMDDVLEKPVQVQRFYERLLHWLDARAPVEPGLPAADARR